MLVRVTSGFYAGQVRDIEPEAARAMLADGRATDIRLEDGSAPAPDPEPAAAEPTPAPAETKAAKVKTKKAPKKRKR